jgi:hypothetical protein
MKCRSAISVQTRNQHERRKSLSSVIPFTFNMERDSERELVAIVNFGETGIGVSLQPSLCTAYTDESREYVARSIEIDKVTPRDSILVDEKFESPESRMEV